jgi:hypothetical protein
MSEHPPQIKWTQGLGQYLHDISAGHYKNNPLSVSINTKILQQLKGSLIRGTRKAPRRVLENIDTVISLLQREVARASDTTTRTNTPLLMDNGGVAVARMTAPTLVGDAVNNADTVNPCPVFYDPCTREPLDNFKALEMRIKSIRKEQDVTPVGLYGLTNATSNYDFLMGVFVDRTISLDDLVSFRLGEGGQTGSDIFEVLSRLFVLFGGIDHVSVLSGDTYKFVKKFESKAPIVWSTPEEALQQMTCKATSSSGISDITIVRSGAVAAVEFNGSYCEQGCDVAAGAEPVTYLMSVKWYKKEKSAEHYDLEKLKLAADKLAPGENVGIVVFLKSKVEFEKAHQRAYRQYVRYIPNTFFGWEEDVKPFLQDIRRQIFEEADRSGKSPVTIITEHYLVPGAKPVLNLQLHQEIIVRSFCNSVTTSEDNRYLIGVLPRGGKTYIAGGIMRDYIRQTGAASMNILWLTAAPTETRSQVGADLISRFADFADFEFVDVVDARERIEKKKPYSFFFCSTQLLTQTSAGARRSRTYLSSLLQSGGDLGMIFYDEAHKTATGDSTREVIDKILGEYSDLQVPLVFLTATYFNILFEYGILNENTFIWDYTDVLKTRGLATESEREAALSNLRDRFKHSSIVDEIIQRRLANGDTYDAMGKPYIEFPELYFITADFQEEALTRFQTQGVYRADAGFSMKSIFAVRQDATIGDIRTADGRIRADAFLAFENLTNPRNVLSLITPSPEGFDDRTEGGEPLVKEGLLDPTILGRIDAISRNADSRFRTDRMPTLMMFMPTGGPGSRIYFTLCAWAALIRSHPWWRTRYEVACVIDQTSLTDEEIAVMAAFERDAAEGIHIIRENPKAQIVTLERRLHCPTGGGTEKGLVILAGQKLSMGVSLPCTDVVFLFNDSKSPDDIIQKMYRALTPSDGKRAAFVVDMNPVRSFAALYGYTRIAGGEAKTVSNILDTIYETYSWDTDFFEQQFERGAEARPQRFMARLREMFEEAEKDPVYRIHDDYKGVEKRVETNIRKYVDERFLSGLSSLLSDAAVGRGFTMELRDGSKASLKSGQLVIRDTPADENAGAAAAGGGGNAPKQELVIENFVEAVKDFVKYLAITTEHDTLEETLAAYVGDPAFQTNVNNMLVARGAITRADPRIVEVMLRTVQELSRHGVGGITRMFGDTKAKIDEPSARKNAVLKIIHHRLTPRKKQKEEKGEVFTPIELVEEMLSHLPASVWKNPDLKWLDPANGIGNFPVVAYYRLMDGLSSVIPNKQARSKHIIENMLYMMELQSSNSRVARNIFRKLCDGCEPNIWTVDSLTVTPASLKARGWPEKFDIIMGNPPFNSGGLLKGTGFWANFVKKAFELLDIDGYICFIHPPGWRKFYDAEEKENQGKLWYTIRKREWNLDYVNVSDQPPKHFPNVDYYVIHAKHTNKPTTYVSTFMGRTDSGETEIDYPFIPNMINDETMSILNKLFGAKGVPIHIIRGSNFEPSKRDLGKPGIPHYHFTDRTGKQIFYNKEYDSIPEYINKPKIIMTFSGGYEKGRLFPFYSDEHIGVTRTAMYMLTKSKEEGGRLVNFFNSDIITFLMKITQYSAPPNHKNEFKILNLLQMPESMGEYHLTAAEKALIARVVGTPENTNSEQAGGASPRRFTRKNRRHM